MSEKYDVIISGMGPAGSVAAYHLAKAGLKVLALEKNTMPREKLCAGGLTPRALEELQDFDFSSSSECEVKGGFVYTHAGHDLEMSSEKEMGIVVDRAKFDHLLLQRAASQGAIVREDEPVIDVSSGDTIIVKTPKASYQARFLIGADGANSLIAQILGYAKKHVCFALECIIPDTYEEISKHHTGLTFYYGFLPSGYGWIFPRQGSASVGIGVLTRHSRKIRDHFRRFLKAISLPPEYADHCKGYPLPAYAPRNHFRHGKKNILLVGDAACLVDPITGEGISYALISGKMAADALLQASQGQGNAAALYGRMLKSIKIDLLVAYLMSIPLNTIPNITILTLRENRELVHILKDITTGQARYAEFTKALFKAVPNTVRAYLKGHR